MAESDQEKTKRLLEELFATKVFDREDFTSELYISVEFESYSFPASYFSNTPDAIYGVTSVDSEGGVAAVGSRAIFHTAREYLAHLEGKVFPGNKLLPVPTENIFEVIRSLEKLEDYDSKVSSLEGTIEYLRGQINSRDKTIKKARRLLKEVVDG